MATCSTHHNMRGSELTIIIYQVKLLHNSETTSVPHLGSSRPCFGGTLTSNPLEEALMDVAIHYEVARNAQSISTYALQFQTFMQSRLSWNLSYPRGSDSHPP